LKFFTKESQIRQSMLKTMLPLVSPSLLIGMKATGQCFLNGKVHCQPKLEASEIERAPHILKIQKNALDSRDSFRSKKVRFVKAVTLPNFGLITT